MSELRFYCPHCNQKIQCDNQWAGLLIQCPACQRDLMVPRPAPVQVAAPPPPTAPPLPQPSIGSSRPHAAPPPLSGSRPPLKSPSFNRSNGNSKAKIIKIAVVSLVAAVGFYFGLTYVISAQKELNRQSDKMAKESDGGEAGHIANLYRVLDATDTDRRGGRESIHVDEPDAAVLAAQHARREAGARMEQAQQALPILPPVWTLDVQSATIPEGRANGSLSGTNFVVESARIDKVGEAFALTLRQGSGMSADREIVIYLKLKSGETIGGHSWTVSKEMAATKALQVIKRWKPDPKFAPKQKMFPSGYAMKLEFAPPADDILTGKIFIALPDPEKTVVGGIFRVSLDVPLVPELTGDL